MKITWIHFKKIKCLIKLRSKKNQSKINKKVIITFQINLFNIIINKI